MPLSDKPSTAGAPIADAGDALLAAQAQSEAMAEQLDALNDLLAKPLNEILAERDKFKEAAAAWDAFGAMWLLSQRAMKRVALDLAAQQGVSEAEVVNRAMAYANDVLNGDGVDLGGTIAEPQMAHIARHRALLRKQFRQG
ncbi:hypothetical protein [Variovorax rhizosphaerae]|uniref:DUF222 domain-containing protein n=1 Tax=Variovorax rhizosphaerae TaxID=1836200 RepID=A0ABU8WH95_9BURK